MQNNQINRPLEREFEGYFKRSYQRAFCIACRLTGNESDAEDLMQDAFLRAWGAFERYDRNHSFDVWLFRILSNLAIDRWRRKSVLKVQSLDQQYSKEANGLPLGSVLPDKSPGPEEMCMQKQEYDKLQNALNKLPDNYRMTIILTDIEEWTYNEVAHIMRCPVGTVRSRLHRGRQLLRQQLLGTSEDFVSRQKSHESKIPAQA
jgi:RNA polymerase sigma-70 factor (ECF subfamily)